MRRNYPFLLMGLAIVSGVSFGCGGDEFGTLDPGPQGDRDGATDGKSPGIDGTSSGGSGGVGGTGGSDASGGSSGAGSGGGTGGSAGKDAGSGGKGGTSADAGPDVIPLDASDGRTDDGLRADADAGRAGDVLDALVMDGPSGSDGPVAQDAPGDSAADGGRDSSVSPDASEAGSDVVCSEPTTYYKDVDGDGFGVSTVSTITCTPPGNNWSVLAGDCRDDLPNVKPYSVNSPDPPVYSGVGYADPVKPQGVSFDYDCTGTEDADPTNSYGAEPNCALLNCQGVGYASVNPARTGNGIDPRCGSTTLHRCNGNILNCLVLTEVTTEPYRCR